jgi:predicted SAM-dependent methyltransferase
MIIKIKQFLKRRLPLLHGSLKKMRNAVREQVSRRRIKKIMAEGKEIYINAGGGNIKGKNGWLIVDLTNDCDIFWDLSKGIPFPANSVKKIYCSHLLEHLNFAESIKFLNSCRKALVPGGTFSVCVPNARIFIEGYLNPSGFDEKKYLSCEGAYFGTGKIDYINYIAYMGGAHKNMFDQENLVGTMKAAGFSQAAPRKFDPAIDLDWRDFESVYAEAVK